MESNDARQDRHHRNNARETGANAPRTDTDTDGADDSGPPQKLKKYHKKCFSLASLTISFPTNYFIT